MTTKTTVKAQTFANTPAGRGQLVKRLSAFPGITVCLEATGVYSFDIALALTDAGLRVSVLNPKASHNAASVLQRFSQTDAVDADTLAQYAERMPYQAWARPTDAALTLRALARRIHTLTRNKAAAKNQRHALTFSPETASAVLLDVALSIAQLEERIAHLAKEAMTFIQAHPLLARRYTLLRTVKGIGSNLRHRPAGRVDAAAPGTHPQAMGEGRRTESARVHLGHQCA